MSPIKYVTVVCAGGVFWRGYCAICNMYYCKTTGALGTLQYNLFVLRDVQYGL